MASNFEHAVIENIDREEFEKLYSSYINDGWSHVAFGTAGKPDGTVLYTAILNRKKKGQTTVIGRF